VFEAYPLPALVYSATQRQALRETIERVDADVVVAGGPLRWIP
jgi:predicted GTPase